MAKSAKARAATKSATAPAAAKPAPPVDAGPMPPPTSARALRQANAAKRKRQERLTIYGIVAAVVLLVGLFVWIGIRNSRPVAGESSYSSQGNTHIPFGETAPIEFNTTPPSSGPHYDNLAAWNVYSEPQRYEFLNHNLEDGGVIIYYQCPEGCPEIVDQLAAIAEPYIDAGRHVVVAPNDPTWTNNTAAPLHKDMGNKIAVVAWTKVLKMDAVDEAKIRAFIDRYEGEDHHVAGIG